MQVELTPITIPDDPDSPEAADFRTGVDIRNRLQPLLFGDQAIIATPAQVLPAWQDQTDEQVHPFLVHVGGETVGRGLLYVPTEGGSAVAEPRVELLPEHWGRGIGQIVMPRLERRAVELGRTVMRTYSNHLTLDDPPVAAATGAGSLPGDHIARFLRGTGYRLEQVYRDSVLDLTVPTPQIDALLTEARASSTGYRFVSWTLPTPPEHRADYAYLKSRMSTDAPSGELQVDEETWDADRVARLDAQRLAQGWFMLIGAAEHVGTGRLVAFTELGIIGARDGNSQQLDTLVRSDHRGHRLGMLVKGENLAIWRELVPNSPKVTTANAEENRLMLAVNESMGFTPSAYGGAWQKTLS